VTLRPFHPHWRDPTWRFLRITSFVTAATVLVVLAGYLSGATSWLNALVVAVVVNVLVFAALLARAVTIEAR
jgi:hypothetical protein